MYQLWIGNEFWWLKETQMKILLEHWVQDKKNKKKKLVGCWMQCCYDSRWKPATMMWRWLRVVATILKWVPKRCLTPIWTCWDRPCVEPCVRITIKIGKIIQGVCLLSLSLWHISLCLANAVDSVFIHYFSLLDDY